MNDNDDAKPLGNKSGQSLPADFRRFVLDVVKRQSLQKIVLVEAQESIRQVLQGGARVQCELKTHHQGSLQCISAVLECTPSGGVRIDAPGLPPELELWSIVRLQPLPIVEFPTFEERYPAWVRRSRSSEDSERNSRKSTTPSGLSASSTDDEDDVEDSALAASSDRDGDFIKEALGDETNDCVAHWNDRASGDHPNLEVRLESPFDLPKTFHVVAEVRLLSTGETLFRRAIPLTRQGKSGIWRARRSFRRPEQTLDQDVQLVVRTLTQDDLVWFDNNDSAGLSDVTRVLAAVQFDAIKLKRKGNTYESQAAPPLSNDDDIIYCVTAVPGNGGDGSHPISVESTVDPRLPAELAIPESCSDNEAEGIKHLKALRTALIEGQTEAAQESFENAWLNIGPKLERQIPRWVRKVNLPSDFSDDIRHEAAIRICRKIAGTENDAKLWAWCFTVARNLVAEFRRKENSLQKRVQAVYENSKVGCRHNGVDVVQAELDRRELEIDSPTGSPSPSTILDQMSPELRDYCLRKQARQSSDNCGTTHRAPSDKEIAEGLDVSYEAVLYRRRKSQWVARVVEGLAFLRDHLQPQERRFIELLELQQAKVSDIERTLGITEAERKKLSAGAILRLHAGIGIQSLAKAEVLDEREIAAVRTWLFECDGTIFPGRPDGIGEQVRRRIGQLLHAQILLETDCRRRDPVPTKSERESRKSKRTSLQNMRQSATPTAQTQALRPARELQEFGLEFLWVRCLQRRSDEALTRMIQSQGFRASKFAGDLEKLREHVRHIWHSTPTLVPAEWRPWTWDRPVRSVEDERERT